MSSARCLATDMSHAAGLSGMPRTFHTSSARQKASWTTSSASARLCTPKMRVSAATRRPDSRRKRCSLNSMCVLHVHLHDRTDFNRSTALENRAAARELHRLIDVARLDEREAADKVLRLGEGTVRHRLLLTAHHFTRPLQRLAAILQVTFLVELVHPRHPALHALLRPFGAAHVFLPCGIRHAIQI